MSSSVLWDFMVPLYYVRFMWSKSNIKAVGHLILCYKHLQEETATSGLGVTVG